MSNPTFLSGWGGGGGGDGGGGGGECGGGISPICHEPNKHRYW